MSIRPTGVGTKGKKAAVDRGIWYNYFVDRSSF
jgi:hypothetical protein